MNIQRSNLATKTPSRYGALVTVLCLSTLILGACGGSDSESASTATASTADGRAQALAVPPGWTGRPPKYEVINGITVPPEPAPSINNATLAGVDLNRNGVRDDVERSLAKDANSLITYSAMIKYAIAYKLQITESPPKDRNTALAIASAIMCSVASAPRSVQLMSMSALFINTPERKAALDAFNSILVGFGPEELSPCN